MIPRRRIVRLTLLVVAAAGLCTTAFAQSNRRAAAWTWPLQRPGATAPARLQQLAISAGADRGSARVLAQADGEELLIARNDGQVEIGLTDGSSVHLESLAAATGGNAVVAYTAASPSGGVQTLLGAARTDVDRVDALLADGSEQQLALNRWRGFSYAASSPSTAAVGLIAYSTGSSIDSVRLPQVVTETHTPVSAVTPLYGVFRNTPVSQRLLLAQVDPRTLHVKPEPSLRLAGQQWFGYMALSPDATKLAIVTGAAPRSGHGPATQRLLIVHLTTMTMIRAHTLAPYTQIRALAWPRHDRLIEIEQQMSKPYQRDVRSRSALIVDPDTGRTIAQHRLINKLAVRDTLSTSLGLLFTLGSSSLHGTSEQLNRVAADGRVRTVTIPIGATHGALNPSALTVDSARGHAYVVVAGGTVFDIDLQTMTMTKHSVAVPHGAVLVPPPISRLQANVFAGKIAVASMFHLPGNSTTPAQGVYLIDPASWIATVLDQTANLFETLGNRILTYGITTPAHTIPMIFATGHGISLYDENGKLVAHLYGKRRFQYVALTPGYGHVIYTGPAVTLRPRTGQILYFGPNDQLTFNLQTGSNLGHSKLSSPTMPAGPPQLIFRGSAAVGEAPFG